MQTTINMMLRREKKYENADKKTMIREEGEVNYKKNMMQYIG